jgi:hypothetical protein
MLLAILNLIFGCLGAVTLILAIVALATVFDVQAAPLPAVPADPTNPFDVMKEQSQFLLNECPNYKTVSMASVGVSVVNMILLISSGIGLLKLKKWARNATFIYVAIGLISTAISTGYQFSAIVPATQKYEKERNEKLIALGKPTPPAMAGVTSNIGAGFGAFCGFLYPIVALGLLLAPSTRKAFSGGEEDDGDRRDEMDDLDPDRPLRRQAETNSPNDRDDRFRAGPGR